MLGNSIKKLLTIAFYCIAVSVNAASLWLETATTGLLQVNQTFDVTVQLNATNTLNENIVLVDAVLEYQTDMLELISVSTSANDSDFFYSYSLVNNSFPRVNQAAGLLKSTVQVVVGVPGSQAVAHDAQANVATLRFRVKQPPLSRSDGDHAITFVFNGGDDYSQSKVIANDGLGTNVLTSTMPLSLATHHAVNVPVPFFVILLLGVLLLVIVKVMPARARHYTVVSLVMLLPLSVSLLSEAQNTAYDLTGDGEVDSQDIGVLLSYWNTSHAASDLNNSGNVDNTDLDLLLSQHNPATVAPPPAPRSSNNAITNSYTYFDAGKTQLQTQTVNGPRTDLIGGLNGIDDITTTVYDPQGNINTVTNALGHVTMMQNYNARGQAREIIDANGVTTVLTYHPRGWLTSRTVKHPIDTNLDAMTTFSYDAVGQLIQIALPDSSVLQYEYDDARRLIAVENTLSERIEYTLDNAGNRTAEVICSAGTGGVTGNACAIQKTQTRVFDALSRLRKDVGATNQTYRYDYDKNDNLTINTDAKTNATLQAFDALNRLTEQVDPDATPLDTNDNPAVGYTYDSQDRIKTVTDQRGLVTTYSYDAFGDMISTLSPDTGLTTYTYDNAGNRTSKTDANGQVVYYRYDALNRLTDVVALNAPNESVVYVYDDTSMGSYGIGRLSHIYDQSGKTTFIYDYRGNVVQKLVEVNGQAYSTQYSYTLADRLSSMVYPGGRQVSYQRDADGRIMAVTTNGVNLVTGISYKAFGPVSMYTFANGITRSMTYDGDYRLTDIIDMGSTSTFDIDYGYDLNSNIQTWDDALNTANNQSFTYDERDRLNTAAGGYGSIDYDYDATGNRTQKIHTESGITTTQMYIYPIDSHRLNSINSDNGSGVQTRSFVYDNVGNTITDNRFDGSVFSLNYNALQRYAQLGIDGIPAASYQYNALGQRVIKEHNGSTLHYHYNELGQLLALSDNNGQVIKEYIYVDDMRVARIINNNGSPQTEYLHNDHLGRPLVLTNQSQQVVWQADYLPFGEVRVVVNNTQDQELGFPGQILDEESGFYYNYFRDYDPSLGRYIQSDPLGLTDGPNTYAYVHANPLIFFDPFGLRNQGNGRRGDGSRSNAKDPSNPECIKCLEQVQLICAPISFGTGRLAMGTGAAIGSAFPGLGTAAGGIGGTVAGFIIGNQICSEMREQTCEDVCNDECENQ